MKILIIGFQRSGTTLLRRIVQGHPEIQRAFHEYFLLKKFSDKESLHRHLVSEGLNPNKDSWGEKVPLYPSARGMSAKIYCETWNKYYPKDGKIIHIVRHPYDVALSVEKKYKGQRFINALRVYKRSMPRIVTTLSSFDNCYTFKYEDLLLNPDQKLKEMFNFCGFDSYKYERKLAQYRRGMYQKIDPSRAFAYKNLKRNFRININNVIGVINDKVGGIEYKISENKKNENRTNNKRRR